MAIDFQLKQANFQYGLAEGTDPHSVPFGVLMTCENFAWGKSGRLSKRFGIRQLVKSILGGGNIAKADRLFTRGVTELCIASDDGLFSYGTGQNVWESIGVMPNAGLTWETAVDSAAGVQASDIAVSAAGVEVRAWVTGDPTPNTGVPVIGSNLYVELVDRSSGSVGSQTFLTISAQYAFGVRVLIIGTTAIVLTRRLSAAPFAIFAATFDLTTLQQTAGVALKSDVATTATFSGWDACVVGNNFVIAYNRTGSIVALESYNTALASQASGTIAGEVSGLTMVSIAYNGTVLAVAYEKATATPRAVRVAIANPASLAQTVAPITVETTTRSLEGIGMCAFDANTFVLSYSVRELDNSKRLTTTKVNNAAVADGSTIRTSWYVYGLTRPFMLGGRCYIGGLAWNSLAADSTFAGFSSGVWEVEFNTFLGLSNIPHRLVGKVDDLTGGMIPFSAPRPEPCIVGGTLAITMFPYLSDAASKVTNWRCGARKLSIAIGASRASDWCRSISYGKDTYIFGSGLSAYDGRNLVDYGFFQAPNINVSTNAAGGNIAAGVYLYGAIEEWRNANGTLFRSEPAIGASLTTTGATSTNTILMSTISVGNKQTIFTKFAGAIRPSRSSVYRSVNGGTIYQRFAYEPGFNVLDADPTQALLTLTDRAPDTDITNGAGPVTPLAARPVLYADATTGVLPDEQPPASTTGFYHVDRLWSLAGDERTFWFSKTFQDDIGVAPGFSSSFRVVFPDRMTGGRSLDEKAVFFSPTKISYMLGVGPQKNGLNSDFTPPIGIQADVGCSNARSLVSTPDGIMFGNDRGIYLLSGGLDVDWIGRSVKDQLAAYPNITSAVLVPKLNQVRFTCNDAAGATGIVLVYDYVEKQWATARYTIDGVYGAPISDACLWNGDWAFVSSIGTVYVEDQTTCLDAGAYVPATFETAWISAAGPIAYNVVRNFYVNGISNDNHTLTISCAFDSDTTTYAQTRSFAAKSPATLKGPLEEAKISVGKRRKCSSIRFKVQDTAPVDLDWGIGQGPSFDSMGIEVGLLRGDKVGVGKKG